MDLRSAGGGNVAAVTACVQYTLARVRTHLAMTRGRASISNISIRTDVTNVVIIILLMSERTVCRPTRDIICMAVRVYEIRFSGSK